MGRAGPRRWWRSPAARCSTGRSTRCAPSRRSTRSSSRCPRAWPRPSGPSACPAAPSGRIPCSPRCVRPRATPWSSTTQDDLAGPAVPQQQVVAEQQAVAVVGHPHHGQPDQRRLTRVESRVAVPGAQGVDLRVRRQGDRADVDAPARLEDLDRVSVVVGAEAGAHDRVPCDHVRHRLGQRVGVQAPVEGEPALRDVVSGRARHLGLEEQAALERGDRCRALGRRGGVRDVLQRAAPVLGDLVGDALGEGELGEQAAGRLVGPGVDLDGVRAALVAAGEVRRLGLAAPAEVVEQHLRAGGEQRGRLRVEVPELPVGDVGALVRLAFGDLAGRGDRVGVRGEPYGCDGGEPADRTGVVVLFEGRDPAVPLQFDREIGGRRLDAGQRGAQRAAQQLGETDAECGGRGAGEAVAHVGGEHDRGLAQLADRGQQFGRLERGDPVAEVVESRERTGASGLRRTRRTTWSAVRASPRGGLRPGRPAGSARTPSRRRGGAR